MNYSYVPGIYDAAGSFFVKVPVDKDGNALIETESERKQERLSEDAEHRTATSDL